jgi:hypothetical protein
MLGGGNVAVLLARLGDTELVGGWLLAAVCIPFAWSIMPLSLWRSLPENVSSPGFAFSTELAYGYTGNGHEARMTQSRDMHT